MFSCLTQVFWHTEEKKKKNKKEATRLKFLISSQIFSLI